MTTLNLTLRNIKHLASMSEETYCYSATVYLNGHPVCTVGNSGHGGPDEQRWLEPKERAAVEAYFAALPMRDTGMKLHGEPFMIQPDLEGWCGQQVSLWLARKDLKRQMSKKTVVFAPNGEEYVWKIDPATLNTEINFRDLGRMTGAAYILSKSEPGSVIANLLSEEELDKAIERRIAA